MTEKDYYKDCTNCDVISRLRKQNGELYLQINELCEKLNKEIKRLSTLVAIFIIVFSSYLFVDYNAYDISIAIYKIEDKYNESVFMLRHKYLNSKLYEVQDDIRYWFSKTSER